MNNRVKEIITAIQPFSTLMSKLEEASVFVLGVATAKYICKKLWGGLVWIMFILIAVILYIVWPVDAVPDPIYDIIVLVLAIALKKQLTNNNW